MKEINIKLFIKDNGHIQIHHDGTGMYTTFKSISLHRFLINQEMKVLDKLSVVQKEEEKEDE